MRDDFTDDVKRIALARVAATCSNPNCFAPTSGPQEDPSKAVNVGVAAHITSAAPGGPRFNQALTPEERRSIDNCIWLCQNCAKLIDNDVQQFPENVLRAWKVLAEHQASLSVGRTMPIRFESEAQRKAHEILKWKDKYVMLVTINTGKAVYTLGVRGGSSHVKVLDCNEFSVRVIGQGWDSSRSVSLFNVELGYDDHHNCLELLEKNP